jgi:hypothetical protein
VTLEGKDELKPWQHQEWRIPPGHNGEFVACMEDALDVYRQERDEKRPPVCGEKIGRWRFP